MQADQIESKARLSDGDVLRFLSENPGFFEEYDSILPRLRIPHKSGSATSLIERQVSVLRERCESLEANLQDFILVARENENLHGRMHTLMQNIVSARSLKQVLKLTQDDLANNFNADGVYILLAGQTAKPMVTRVKSTPSGGKKPGRSDKRLANELPPGTRILQAESEVFGLFDDISESGITRCGMPSAEQLKALARDEQANVASAALIPLTYKRRIGVIMLTSRDVERFSSGKGVMFLDQFGGLLSRRLHGMRIIAQHDQGKPPSLSEATTQGEHGKKVCNGGMATENGDREGLS